MNVKWIIFWIMPQSQRRTTAEYGKCSCRWNIFFLSSQHTVSTFRITIYTFEHVSLHRLHTMRYGRSIKETPTIQLYCGAFSSLFLVPDFIINFIIILVFWLGVLNAALVALHCSPTHSHISTYTYTIYIYTAHTDKHSALHTETRYSF